MAQPPGVVGSKDTMSHTRLYHHTTSMFPYSALDAEDSEAEDTPSWLPARTSRVCVLSVLCVIMLHFMIFPTIVCLYVSFMMCFCHNNHHGNVHLGLQCMLIHCPAIATLL